MAAGPPALLAMRGGFDGLYGQDPFAYIDYAVGPLRQSLIQLAPPPPFYWPPGYPVLVSLASLVVGLRPLAGQLVSLAAAASVPISTVFLAQATCPTPRWRLPILAGLIVACCPQVWQSSIVVMADTTGLAAATLAARALARYARTRGSLGWLVMGAAALAWAIITRWIYALVALPLALEVLETLRHCRPAVAVRHASMAIVVAGMILAPVLVPLLLGVRTASGDTLAFATDLDVYRWDPLNALRRDFLSTADGHLSYALPNGLYYALAPASPNLLTPIFAALAILGVLEFRYHGLDAPKWAVVGWLGVVYAFHAGAPWQNFRFTLAYLPPLAVLAAFGSGYARRLLATSPVRRVQAVLVFGGLLWMLIAGARLTQSFIDRKHADLDTVHWVESQTPPTARLLTFGLTLTFQHYSQLRTLDVFEHQPAELVALVGDGRPSFLLIDVAGVQSQWQGLPPQANYAALAAGPGLTQLGQHGAYTLFRIGILSPAHGSTGSP